MAGGKLPRLSITGSGPMKSDENLGRTVGRPQTVRTYDDTPAIPRGHRSDPHRKLVYLADLGEACGK
jgi:hypothetical protein